jgi:diguanylate cyclase (GGDEF)-like protein
LTNTFKKIDARDGLPSRTISSFIEDDRGIMWATSLNGIISIDPADFSIRVLYKSHGSVTNSFNRDATYKDKSGQLYMGGVDGFTVFDPSVAVAESAPPEVVITDFRLFNKSVTINDEHQLLSKPITLTNTLALSYKHVMFSFEFAALSYRSSDKNQYAYKLEGFDKDWNMIGTQYSATYTNLDPGDYVFRVKAANSDGVWNEQGKSIAISIAPPPWRTWWAYIGYLLLLTAIYYVVRKYEKLRIASDTYKTLSTTDQLTGIYNRAGAIKITEELFKRINPNQQQCIVIFDIDYFKRINDTYGHDVGDEILKGFANLITNSIRTGDVFARWGGEEFVLICCIPNKLDIKNLAEKLCRIVAAHSFEAAGYSINITTIIGIACTIPAENLKSLFKRADIALYEAKATGRNRFVIAE